MKNREMLGRFGWAAGLALLVCAVQVQAAGTFIVDLTSDGAEETWNGALLWEVGTRSTGTGTFQPFLRLQDNTDTLAGYNTDGPLEFDAKDPWTRALPLDNVPLVEKDGVSYREFLLDINQNKTGDGRLYSLDVLEIYQTDDQDLTGYPSFGGEADLVWELDASGALDEKGADDVYIKLDYSNNTGSGSGDMAAYIPNSLFTGKDYVVLYSEFGESDKLINTASFEEWGVGDSAGMPPVVPVPGAIVLGVIGVGFVGRLRRRGTL